MRLKGSSIFRLLFAAGTLVTAGLAVAGQTPEPTPDDELIKVDTLLINVPLIVTDRDGRFIGGLKKDNFIVRIGDERQEIEYFTDSEAPVTVAIILDMSGSTRSNIGQIRDAAKKFVEGLKATDRAMVVTFDQYRSIDVVTGLTSDRKKLADKIGGVSHPRITDWRDTKKLPVFPDMYDAIHQVMTKQFAGVTGRKAIIVLTDGFVVGRTVTPLDFNDTIIEGDTVIYPMMFLTRQHVGPGTNSISYDDLAKLPVTIALDDIAKKTGGRLLIAAKDTDFKTAFQAVGDELRKQYSIGFYPSQTNVARGGQIGLGVNLPGMKVRSKNTIRLKRRDPR